MKNLTIILLAIIAIKSNGQQIINFEDQNLKAYFISEGYDDNLDNEVDDIEALDVYQIELYAFHNVTYLKDLEAFTNLTSIDISEYSTISSANIHDLPNLTNINFLNSSSFNNCTLKNLPNLSTVNGEKTFYLYSLEIENAPNLKKFNMNLSSVREISLIDVPKLRNYTFSNTHKIILQNVGRPKWGRLSCYYYTSISNSNEVHIENIDSLEKLSFSMMKNTDIKIINNSFLKEITIDGHSNFDSLDLTTNYNLEKIRWDKNSSVVYNTGAGIGCEYMNISGLHNLKSFDKYSDFTINELVFDTLNSLTSLTLGAVNIKDINCDFFPNLNSLTVDHYCKSLTVKNHSSLSNLEHYHSSDQPFEPDYVLLENCELLYDIDFQNQFSPDSLILKDLPIFQTKGFTYSLNFNYLTEYDRLTYLEVDNVFGIDEMVLTSDSYYPENLKTLIIKNQPISDSSFVLNCFELENLQINSTSLKSLNLSLLSELKHCDVTQNDSLDFVCVFNINTAKNSSDFTKDSHTNWRNNNCEEQTTSSVKEAGLESASIYPNPASNIIYVSNLKGHARVNVIDVQGKSVINFVTENETKIDINPLSPGIYFVKIGHENGDSQIEKLIVER